MRAFTSHMQARRAGLALGLCAAFVWSPSFAEPLPEPLTLEYALAHLSDDHPRLALSRAAIEAAEAGVAQAESGNDFDARLRLEAAWTEPNPEARDQSHDDSLATLHLSKPLYDFGRTDHAVGAASRLAEGRRLLHGDERRAQRMEIMQRYLDVVLADQEYGWAYEVMAIAFVTLDKARDRNELGQVSDIDLSEREAAFQESRAQWVAATQRQRTARALLAESLNRPGELPSTVSRPRLVLDGRELPDVAVLLEQALHSNPRLAALQRDAEAAAERIAAARAGRKPLLSAEATAGTYRRDLGGRDAVRAGLVLEVPLYTGGRTDAAIAAAQAEARQAQARAREYEYRLRQAVLEAWQEIQVLKVRREQATALGRYREMYADRSRAYYELELQTDFGDSMIEQSAAELFGLRTDYELVLAWERLAQLTGHSGYSLFADAAPSTDQPSGRAAGARPEGAQ